MTAPLTESDVAEMLISANLADQRHEGMRTLGAIHAEQRQTAHVRALAAEVERLRKVIDDIPSVSASIEATAYVVSIDALRAEVVALEQRSEMQRTRAKRAEAEVGRLRADVETLSNVATIEAERHAKTKAALAEANGLLRERNHAGCDALAKERDRLRAALVEIASSDFCTQGSGSCHQTDIDIAKAALSGGKEGT